MRTIHFVCMVRCDRCVSPQTVGVFFTLCVMSIPVTGAAGTERFARNLEQCGVNLPKPLLRTLHILLNYSGLPCSRFFLRPIMLLISQVRKQTGRFLDALPIHGVKPRHSRDARKHVKLRFNLSDGLRPRMTPNPRRLWTLAEFLR